MLKIKLIFIIFLERFELQNKTVLKKICQMPALCIPSTKRQYLKIKSFVLTQK